MGARGSSSVAAHGVAVGWLANTARPFLNTRHRARRALATGPSTARRRSTSTGRLRYRRCYDPATLTTIFALVLLALSWPASAAAQAPAPTVTQFSPTGVVKQVRQVTARFSVPMVAVGDPRAATDVFDIDCAEAGTARWIDSRDWAYDFARDLPAGVRCVFRLRAG